MTNAKRKILAIAVVCALMLTLAPSVARAEVDSVTIGGTSLNEGELAGNALWSGNTITLNGGNYGAIYIFCPAADEVTIVVNGNVTVTSSGGTSGHAIECAGKLTINASASDASLTARATSTDGGGNGIDTGGDLKINVPTTASGGQSSDAFGGVGIFSKGSITIGSPTTATGGKNTGDGDGGSGINGRNITINAVATATGGESNSGNGGDGIHTNSSSHYGIVTINAPTTAIGGKGGTGNGFGINIADAGGVEVIGGPLTTGTSGGANGNPNGNLVGDLNVTSGAATIHGAISRNLIVTSGAATIHGTISENLTVTSGTATLYGNVDGGIYGNLTNATLILRKAITASETTGFANIDFYLPPTISGAMLTVTTPTDITGVNVNLKFAATPSLKVGDKITLIDEVSGSYSDNVTASGYTFALSVDGDSKLIATVTAVPAVKPPADDTSPADDTPPPPYIPAPIISGFDVSPSDTGATLSVNAYAGGLPIDYQWYFLNPATGLWTAIPGATGPVFDYSGLPQGQQYTVRARVGVMGSYAFSQSATFTVAQGQPVVISTPEPETTFPASGTIIGRNVNVRPNANTRGKALAKLQNGDEITVVGYETAFTKLNGMAASPTSPPTTLMLCLKPRWPPNLPAGHTRSPATAPPAATALKPLPRAILSSLLAAQSRGG